MLGTIVNVVAIIIGSIFGLLVKNAIKKAYATTIMDGLGVSIMLIGIMSGIKVTNMTLAIGSIVIGAIIGEALEIEERLNDFGNILEKSFGRGDSNFSKAFVTTSLLYCIGAMAIVGSLESGLINDHTTLFAKSILDGVAAIIFASTMGIGVIFSALSVFIYQGSITLLANSLRGVLTPEVINEMSAVGGILILAMSLNHLGIKKIRIGNLLPAMFMPIIYFIVVGLF